MTQIVGNLLVTISAALCLVFVGLYHRLTGGDWRRSEAGRHLMISMATFGAVLSLTAVRIVIGDPANAPWFVAIRVAVFSAVPIIFAWRIWLLVRAQRRD